MAHIPSWPAVGSVVIAHGVRSTERRLLERIDELLAAPARDPSLLAAPVRVVVPSASLRDHLLSRLVAFRRGRAAAGIVVQTLFSLAAEALERSGEESPSGEHLFELVVRREAGREPVLAEPLAGLVEGFAPAAGTIRDLIDAGLEPVHAEAAEEALRAEGLALAGRAAVARAIALVRAASRTEERLVELGRGRRSHLLRRAAELLSYFDPGAPDPLPARALLIHGFADATGLATDLLEALVRKRGATVFLDQPRRAAGGGFETAFAERFGARLVQAATTVEREEDGGGGATEGESLAAFEALGTEAEVREATRRLRALLDAGHPPERLGVVARDLAPYRFALARHFGRAGIPFHAPGTGGAADRAGRRRAALLKLLEDGEKTTTDRWLDAHAPATPGASGGGGALGESLDVDLRLALLSLGAARLREVADLPTERVLRRAHLNLPLRQGLPEGEEEEGEPAEARAPSGPESGEGGEAKAGFQAVRRSVSSRAVQRMVRSAQRLRQQLQAWPVKASFARHAQALRKLVLQGLGWRADDEVRLQLERALRSVGAQVPADLRIERDELRLLLARTFLDSAPPPLGGRGGGVQILSVTEARGRTFDHLFVLGLQRNSFPRAVRQDALLTDDLRALLRRVLPDIPLKLEGFEEERYLFAQLLSAAPHVVLSWQVADDDGKPLPPSPLVSPLRGRMEVDRAPALWSATASGLLSAQDRAVYAGLYGLAGGGTEARDREAYTRLLPWALAESRGAEGREPDPPTLRLAAARAAVLAEIDPDLRTGEGRAARVRLGPYFGFLGAFDFASERSDPRRRAPFVTHLEKLAACPWQLFLERLLGIEPSPDPTGLLPGIDALLVGRAVHAVLEEIGNRALAAHPETLEAGEPVAVPWPETRELEALARQEAERLLAEDGVHLPGLTGALARQTLPYLEVARRVDWGAGPLSLLSVEKEGTIVLASASGRLHEVGFRADRLDLLGRNGRGVRRWTDYKTGRPLSEAKGEGKRREKVLARVRAGTHLQAAAYLHAGAEAEEAGSLGRYLYLRPDLEGDEAREIALTRADAPILAAFNEATSTLLESWEAGSFFPRLVEIDGRQEPLRCSRCQVAEACLRGDSGARGRLHAWASGEGGDRLQEKGRAEVALLGTWFLAAPPEGEGGGAGEGAAEAAEPAREARGVLVLAGEGAE